MGTVPACPALPRAQCVGPAHCSKTHKHLENNLFSLPQCDGKHDCFPKQCWSNAYFQKAPSVPCDMPARAMGTRPPGPAYTPHLHLHTPEQHSPCRASQATPQTGTALHLPTSSQLAPGAPARPTGTGLSWLGGGTFLPPSQGQIPAPLTRLRDRGHQAPVNCSDDSSGARGAQPALAHCGCRAVPREHQPWLPALVQHRPAKAGIPPAGLWSRRGARGRARG